MHEHLRPLNPDSPGKNTALRPQESPAWLRKLISTIADDRAIDQLTRELTTRGRFAQKVDHEKRAAVLMLLSGDEHALSLPADATILLTHRSPTLRKHSGQIAFPGGRVDPTDSNSVDCALREAWEETGLDRNVVLPLAQMPELHIRASGYPVVPILGFTSDTGPVRVIDECETDQVFNAPLADLINPENRFRVGMGEWTGPAFWIDDFVIWGFTASLLSAMIEQAGWEQPWNTDKIMDLAQTIDSSRNNEQWD